MLHRHALTFINRDNTGRGHACVEQTCAHLSAERHADVQCKWPMQTSLLHSARYNDTNIDRACGTQSGLYHPAALLLYPYRLLRHQVCLLPMQAAPYTPAVSAQCLPSVDPISAHTAPHDSLLQVYPTAPTGVQSQPKPTTRTAKGCTTTPSLSPHKSHTQGKCVRGMSLCHANNGNLTRPLLAVWAVGGLPCSHAVWANAM